MKWMNRILGARKASKSSEAPSTEADPVKHVDLINPVKQAEPVDWRGAMQAERISEDEFYRFCRIALQELMPGASIAQGESADAVHITKADGSTLNVSFYNTYRNVRTIPEGRVEQVEKLARAFGPTNTPDAPLARDTIVPLVKDVGYLESFGKTNGGANAAATEHIVADLWIVYAVDLPDSMRTLRKEHIAAAGLQMSELRAIAVENLRRILPPVMRHGDGPVFMLSAGSDYVASLLLFDDIWEELQDVMDGDVVAAVPTRDVVLFTSSTSKEGLESMRESVTRIMDSGAYLVSSSMLRRTADGWKPFS